MNSDELVHLEILELGETLEVTVAGPPNEGKTSILRTLLRDQNFGTIGDISGTTKDVVPYPFKYQGSTYLIIYDTPGIEYASEAIHACKNRVDFNHIQTFYGSEKKYNYTRKALEQVRKSDLVLLVINCCSDFSEDNADEVKILMSSKVPVVIVFNQAMSQCAEQNVAMWNEYLESNGWHDKVMYDAHVYDPVNEDKLFDYIYSHIKSESRKKVFGWFRTKRQTDDSRKSNAAIREIADMLLDCAAYVYYGAPVDEAGKTTGRDKNEEMEFEINIRERENRAYKNILTTYNFGSDVLERKGASSDHDPVWSQDLFGANVRKHMGAGAATGAGAGAAAGVTFDLIFVGASFGLFALAGAAIGAGVGALGGAGTNYKFDRKLNRPTYRLDAARRRVLIERALSFLSEVKCRGMADQREFMVSGSADIDARLSNEVVAPLLQELERTANEPSLSTIGMDQQSISKTIKEKREAVIKVIDKLLGMIEQSR